MITVEEAFALAERRERQQRRNDGFSLAEKEINLEGARSTKTSALTSERTGRSVFDLRLQKGAFEED
jgi:hypothetical protein